MNDFIGLYKIPRATALALSCVYDTHPQLFSPGAFLLDGHKVVDPNIKDCAALAVSTIRDWPQVTDYFSALTECTERYKAEYIWSTEHQASWAIVEDSAIQVYPPGGGYKVFHYEKSGGYAVNRHLVFMTFLSDIPEEEGGGTEFFYQDRVIPCELGSTLIWPAEWTHTHRGVISHTREKRIVTGWFSYLPGDAG